MQKTREQIMNMKIPKFEPIIAFDYPLDVSGNSMSEEEREAHKDYIEKIGVVNVVGGYAMTEAIEQFDAITKEFKKAS